MEDEPTLGAHLLWIWQAFTDLNYRRGHGFSGPVPISYTDIDAYCRLKGIYAQSERERLLRLIDPLDRQWMKLAHEQSEKGRGKAPPSPTKKPPRGGDKT